MSKIIGVTVGTPMSPQSIARKLKPVLSVNGELPDEGGNVIVDLESAVKDVMTDGEGAAWTAEEQAAARQRTGAVSLQEVLKALPVYNGEVADA